MATSRASTWQEQAPTASFQSDPPTSFVFDDPVTLIKNVGINVSRGLYGRAAIDAVHTLLWMGSPSLGFAFRAIRVATSWAFSGTDYVELATVSAKVVPGTSASQALTPLQCRGKDFLPAEMIPYRTLAASNYLVLYQLQGRMPTKDEIVAPLLPGIRTLFENYLAHSSVRQDVGKAAARMWTSNAIYKALNIAVISDNAGLLQHWMPFIRALNNHILRFQPESSMITRRKSWMTPEQAARVEEGVDYRLANYVATSKETWDNYPEGVGGPWVRIEFDIPVGCFQACDIQRLSQLPTEAEVILVPYSPVRVTRKVTDPSGVILIKMSVYKDGKYVAHDMPTVIG